MVAYANTNAQLEARRDTALANEGQGPRYVPSLPPSLPPFPLMVAYANTHAQLEARRDTALAS